jgi:NAD-dependent deacetylase
MKGVILTGAGISAESGIAVFRGDDGLWEGHQVEDVATPAGFRRDAETVHRFYNGRRRRLAEVGPNAAHLALARLARDWPGELTLVTQNIDDLHERAGSPAVLHMHGELRRSRCAACGAVAECLGDLSRASICGACGELDCLRPHVVWFGEMPFHMNEIEQALEAADWFVSIGTSGRVYPAAGFVQVARSAGARTLELNLDPGDQSAVFDESRFGPATECVPRWVDEVLAGGAM